MPGTAASGDAETMQRLLVVGTSGAGKTTLARRLAERYQLSHIELDRLFWRPGWRHRERDEFRRLVEQAVSAPGWVADGNYGMLRDLLWPRATHVIWLNYPLPLVVWQVTRRTVANILAGRDVFPGCRETFANSFMSRQSVIWWTISTYHERRRRYAALRRAQTFPQLAWRELRSPRETRHFLAGL
jgi:adenylate kinase family enzyme